jgi:hypothetical protein
MATRYVLAVPSRDWELGNPLELVRQPESFTRAVVLDSKIKWLISKLKKMLNILDKFNWRKYIQILSLPIIIYQVFNLIDNYLKYPTEVSVEWIPFRDSNNRLTYESIPAITVCYENYFQKLLFDEKIRIGFESKFKFKNYYNKFKCPALKINDTFTQNVCDYFLSGDWEYHCQSFLHDNSNE